jgi:hypothetical protein
VQGAKGKPTSLRDVGLTGLSFLSTRLHGIPLLLLFGGENCGDLRVGGLVNRLCLGLLYIVGHGSVVTQFHQLREFFLENRFDFSLLIFSEVQFGADLL